MRPPVSGEPSPAVRGWWRHRLMLFGVSCLVFCALFFLVASAVNARDTHALDQSIRQWILGRRTTVGLAFFGAITHLGQIYVLAIAALIVGLILRRRGARIRPLLVIFVPFFPRMIVHALKDSYQVTRPALGLELSNSASFPSGHTSGSTAIALVLGYVLVREGVAPRLGPAIAVSVPLLIGLSRIYLDMHWASDVIAGWIFGIAFAGAVCALYELMRMVSPRHRALSRVPDEAKVTPGN